MFGLAVVGYLFLGGVGGGLLAVAGAVALLGRPRSGALDSRPAQRSLFGTAFAVAALSLVLGSLLLLADAGNYAALPWLFFSPRPTYLTFGSWALAVGVLLGFLGALLWFGRVRVRLRASRLFHGACIVAGLAIALYTGLYLSSMGAVAFWNGAWVPALFVLSSLSCGLVLFSAAATALGSGGAAAQAAPLLRIDIAVAAAELVVALAFVLVAAAFPEAGSRAVGAQSAVALMTGPDAWLWWGVFMGLGVAAVVALDVAALRTRIRTAGRLWNTLAPAVCVLLGALAMRYCIVEAGMHPALGF